MRIWRLLPLLASIMVVADPVQEAPAYEFMGYSWDYGDIPVTYRINSSGSQDISGGSDFDAIKDSFQTWEDVTCSYLSFTYGGTTSKTSDSWGVSDGTNLMVWEEKTWPSYLSGAIGVTAPIVNYSGDFVDVDILFNGVDFQWSTSGSSTRVDVQNIATHEIGHLAGLEDLYNSWDMPKTMYGYSYEGETYKRTLHQDDVDGLCELYDNGSPVPDVSEGEFGDPCESGGDCQSGLCVTDGEESMCSECCEPHGSNTCPSGYDCARLQDPWEGCEGACWPEEESDIPSPELDEIGDREVYAGDLLEFQVTANPPLYQYQFSFSVENIPNGAFFNTGTRTFSWQPLPKQAGVWEDIEFRVENAEGEFDREKIDITVLEEEKGGDEGGCYCGPIAPSGGSPPKGMKGAVPLFALLLLYIPLLAPSRRAGKGRGRGAGCPI